MKFLNKIESANKLVQDSSNRLVTDAEKSTWNSKASGSHNHTLAGLSEKSYNSLTDKPSSLPANGGNADTVNGKTVLSDVPADAKFTDTNTTYSEITTAEIDAGTASTLRTITGRRVKYILDKVSSMVSTVISSLTKNDVGLGNVDNIQQATKSEFNSHNADSTRHIISSERTKWNTVDNKVDKVTGKQLSTEDYSIAEKDKLSGIEVGANKYTHPSTHPASMITESSTKRFVSDLEKIKWDDYYRGNWDTVRFTVNGDADTYYPVTLTGLHMNEATMSFLEIYRAYSWTAPGTWYTPTHKGGLNLSIDYSLAGWGGQNYELQLTLSQTYSRMVADVITALPDTRVIVVWLRGGTALYELRRQSKDVRVTVYDGVQNPLPFKRYEGTQYENIYDSKTVIEPWFNFTGIKKLLTTEGRLYIGGGYRNPKNSIELYHENNKPTKVDIGLGNVDNTSDLNKPISTATQTVLNGKVNNNQVLTNVPSGAKFTDTITTINGKTGTISKADIVALGIPAQDTVYTHPSHTAKTNNLYKVTVDSQGHISAATAVVKADITALGIPAQDTVYTHPTTAGNKHIPTGGAANQFLKYSASGTAVWSALPASDGVNITASASAPSNPKANDLWYEIV